MSDDIRDIARDFLLDAVDTARGDEETFANEDEFLDYAFGAHELDNTLPGYESHDAAMAVLTYDRLYVGERLEQADWPINPFDNPTGALVWLVRDAATVMVYNGEIDMDDLITGTEDE